MGTVLRWRILMLSKEPRYLISSPTFLSSTAILAARPVGLTNPVAKCGTLTTAFTSKITGRERFREFTNEFI